MPVFAAVGVGIFFIGRDGFCKSKPHQDTASGRGGQKGGREGGLIIAKGTPEQLMDKGVGYTAQYLKEYTEKELTINN